MSRTFWIILSTLLLFIAGCTKEAPTVDISDLFVDSPVTTSGTIYPEIMVVYPGTLQNPAATPTAEISPNNTGIVIVFSHSMNANAVVASDAIQLLDSGSQVSGTSVSPDSGSSLSFVINAPALTSNHQYVIRIYDTAADTAGNTLIFDNLGLLTPSDHVDYSFQTGAPTPDDTSPPGLASTNPANSASGIAVDLSYIEIVFDEMPNPTTVTNSSIRLYNVTDSLWVTGNVVIDPTDANLRTFRFYSESVLLYLTDYRLYISYGGTILCDFSENYMAQDTADFTTETLPASNITYYAITDSTSSSIIVEWTTDVKTTKHIDIDYDASNYAAADATIDDTSDYNYNHSHPFSGLTANQPVSLRIQSAASESGSPIDDTVYLNGLYRSLPTPSDNYQLAVYNSIKSDLKIVQISTDNSFTLWKDGTSIYGQYFDTSAGVAGTWDKWPNTTDNRGAQIFNATGSLDAIYNGSDGVIATLTNTSIYSDSIYNSAGLARHWGGPVTIYNGGTANEAKAAISYSGYVTEVTNGASDMEYVYDTAAPFASTNVGDLIINEADSGADANVSTKIDNSFITLSNEVISSGNLNYRIGNPTALTPNNVLRSTAVDDTVGSFATTGTFTVQGSPITVDNITIFDLSTLATEIDSISNINCTVTNPYSNPAYLVITATNGADIILGNGTFSDLTQFGLTAGTTEALTMSGSSGLSFYSTSDFAVGAVGNENLILSTTGGYLTTKTGTNSPWQYTVNRPIGIADGNSFLVYTYKTKGTAETNVLYDAGKDFSAANVGDIVVNLATGVSEQVAVGGTTFAADGLLILTTTSTGFLFPTDNTNYLIFNLEDNADFVTGGQNTAYGALTVTQTGRISDFVAAGVAIGDIIYNATTDRYAEITNVTATVLTLSSQIFTANTQPFVIFTYKAVTYAWMETSGGSNNIYGKTVDLNNNGTGIFPDATTASKFTITDTTVANNCRHPFAVSDLNGNVIVIYELPNGGNWDICAKKVGGSGNFIWGGAASTAGGNGIAIVAAQAEDPDASRLIVKVLSDGYGGAWVVYTPAGSSVGIAHITSAGVVTPATPYTIASAYHPDAAIINTSNVDIGVVFELYTTSAPYYKRVYLHRYRYNGTVASNVDATDITVSTTGATANQINPRIIGDASNGSIISWLETRYYPTIYYSIFAQHFDSTFLARVGVYGSQGDQFIGIPVKDDQDEDPYLIEHGLFRYNDGSAPNGGVFLWLDERAGEKDIYFQNFADN